jgi:conjugal transfer/type IV secretion protein DotA/TraY
MEETMAPGGGAGISTDIFGEPTGFAFEAAQLLFGDWLGLVFNSSGSSGGITMLTPIAGYVNFIAYTLISIIMGYVLISAVIKTASEGTIMGKGWSSVWLPLRTFLACFLIFPVGIGAASTISFIQVTVVWIGGVGSNAADEVAEFSINNISRKVFNVNQDGRSFKIIKDLTQNSICTYAIERADPTGRGNQQELIGIVASESDMRLSRDEPVYINTSLSGQNKIGVGRNGNCGTIQVNSDNPELKKSMTELLLDYQVRTYYEVAIPLVASSDRNSASPYDFESGYRTYSSYLEGFDSTSDDSAMREVVVDRYYNAVANQLALMDEFKNDIAEILAESMNTETKLVNIEPDSNGNVIVSINPSTYNDAGWPYLGAYYSTTSMALGKLKENNNLSAESVFSNNAVQGCDILNNRRQGYSTIGMSREIRNIQGGDSDCIFTDIFATVDILAAGTDETIANGTVEEEGIANKLEALCTGPKNCNPSAFQPAINAAVSERFIESADKVSESGTTSAALSAFELLGWGLDTKDMVGFNGVNDGAVNSNGYDLGAMNLVDPIYFTSELGQTIIYLYNILKGVSIGIEATAKGVASASGGLPLVGAIPTALAELAIGFIAWGMSILKPIYYSAIGMAYFLPMLPVLIWAMAFISWLLMYAEAIFNAPLAVTLLATPEGDGISGSRMERKIAMIAALMLRPTFLVVGLLLSMFFLSVGFAFINNIFWVAAAGTFAEFSLLATSSLIGIWFIIITIFTHNIMKVMMNFADESLEWFLGGITRPFGNNFDGSTMSKFESTGDKSVGNTGSALSGSIGVFGRNLGERAGGAVAKSKGKSE